ncbi:MAG: anti-CBASS protein Acb1 family protein [Shewanella sp.]
MSGLGMSVDQNSYRRWTQPIHDEVQVHNSFATNWMMRRAIELPIKDMLRPGRSIKAKPDVVTALEAQIGQWKLWHKLHEALLMGAMGGGAIIIGGPGLPIDPLPTITPNSIRYIHVVSRWELTLGQRIRDIEDVRYGEPEDFRVSSDSGSAMIHPSRVIPFKGNVVPRWRAWHQERDYWGDPLFMTLNEPVLNAQTVQQSFATLINKTSIDIVKLKKLYEALASQDPKGEAAIIKRAEYAIASASNLRAMIMDTEEGVERLEQSFTGMPEMIMATLAMVAAARGIPATKFIGKSPDGQNSTGDSDDQNYSALIAEEQRTNLDPVMAILDPILMANAGVSDPDFSYAWNPLSEMTSKEKADIAKTKADTAAVYANSGTVPIDALALGVQAALVEDGTYPGLKGFLAAAEPIEQVQEVDETDPSELTSDAAPRTLYVSRKLLNSAEFIKWAKSQGFSETLDSDDLHVTVLYSKTLVDWMEMGQSWEAADGTLKVAPGGARLVEKLGGEGAVVLLFNSESLVWRHKEMVRNGASHDYPEYQPHVTITYNTPADLDLAKVEPYRGSLVFSPEIFEEIKPREV